MRVVFAIIAVSLLSTSAHARECYKLSWAERGECHRTDPTYPIRYNICLELRDERGYFAVEAATNHGHGGFLTDCMQKLSPLSMDELTQQGRRLARAQNYSRVPKAFLYY
jgi:hypothetical protein